VEHSLKAAATEKNGGIMKRIALAIMAILMAASVFAAKRVPTALTPLQEADIMYAERNAVTDTAKALENADKCITAYKNIFEKNPSDGIFFKYVLAVDFKNSYLVADKELKKQAYKDLITVMDKFCGNNILCASSNYMAYSSMTLWGRYGEIIDIMEAATSGIAEKVKNNAEKIYALDRTFKGWVASYALGRLHYKAPNIVFVLTWPDKNLSKKYLEEYNAANPADILGKTYLADTLWDLGDKEKAIELYKQAVRMEPRKSDYFEDISDLKEAAARAKEQGIQ
jgi:tetratricopeptide (TPR) repeat protein